MGKRRRALLCGLSLAILAPLPAGANAPAQTATTTFHAVDGVASRAVACASATRCISAGATTLISDDGGISWRAAAQPIGKPPTATADTRGPFLQTLACASASLCLAAGYQFPADFSSTATLVWRSTDAGNTWSFVKAIPTKYGLNRLTLACPSAKRCILDGDGVIHITNDGGSTWATTSTTLRAVRCDRTLAARCTGTDGATPMYSNDSGATWHKATFAKTVLRVIAPVCPSATLCLSAAQDRTRARTFWALRSTDGGHSYHAVALTTGVSFAHDIGCVSPTSCVMFGIRFNHNTTLVARTTDGGRNWQPAAAPTPTPGQFVCTTTRCVFAAASSLTDPPSVVGPIATSDDVGLSWHTRKSSATADELTVACVNANDCIAAGEYGVSTSGNFGNSWTFRGGPPGGHSIACTSPTHCFMVAYTRVDYEAAQTVFETTDGGSTWHAVLTRVDGGASAVVCPTAVRCFAQFSDGPVGEPPRPQFDWNPNSGWTPAPDGSVLFHTAGSLVCVPGRCYAIDDGAQIWSSPDEGGSWAQVTQPYHTTLSRFACVDALHCVGVGVQSTIYTPRIVRTSDGGASWSYDTTPPVHAGGVTCNITGRCLALSEQAVAESLDSGATWTLVALPGLVHVADARCRGANCVIVGDITLRT